jgi:alkylation response protein AidB-like acyl-CoA dehydrogenase
MDFSITEEQRMLQDTTRRFLASEYGFECRSRVLASEAGWSREVWRQLGELGLLAIELPEEHGGIGADPVRAMLVAQAVGGGLMLEPFLSSALVGTRAIVRLGSAEQRGRWLPGLASGEQVVVLAHEEGHSAIDLSRVAARARSAPQGYVLSGRKSTVYHAPLADLFLVSARLDDGTLALFAVPSRAAGIARRDLRTLDGQRAADLAFENVAIGSDARLGQDVSAELLGLLDYGIAALCAEALGTLERILAGTLEHSRSRRQFGAPIGSFQALQHRMADMLIQVEQARSMSYLATARSADPDARVRRAALSSAKALIGQAARRVGQEAVQLHGGMGMSDELDISHCFKRLLAMELRMGTTEEHLQICRQRLLDE